MKRLLIGVMLIMTIMTVCVGCGDKEESSADEGDTETVEFYQGKLDGTFVGSDEVTYTFADGKVTTSSEGSEEKKGSFTVSEGDSDGDGEYDCISVRITMSGNSSSYTLSMEGDNIVFTEGSKKTVLTKQ